MTPRGTLELRVFTFPHVRGTLWLCYVYIPQLTTPLAEYTLPFTLQLCCKPLGILRRVTKGQKVHQSSNVLQKLHNIDFVRHNSRGFLIEGVEKQEFPAFPINFFENNQKPFL